MPLLKTILSGPVPKEYRTLKGKIMECISMIGIRIVLISYSYIYINHISPFTYYIFTYINIRPTGLSVGKAKFVNDARDIINLMYNIQNSGLESDDPLSSFLHQSWARICKCLVEINFFFFFFLNNNSYVTAGTRFCSIFRSSDALTDGNSFYYS